MSSSDLFEAIERHDVRRVIALLSAGINPNIGHPQQPEWSPLKSAIDELSDLGPVASVIVLLRHGAAVDEDKTLATPLLIAVINQQPEAVRLLLAAGADPNVRDEEGDSPLLSAVVNNDFETVELLLCCGATATINERGGPAGMSALGRAAWGLSVPIVRLLLEFGADVRVGDTYRSAIDCLPPIEAADSRLWNEVKSILNK